MVVVSNGSVDNPAGGNGGTDLPFAMQGQDVAFKHPTSYQWSAGIQREIRSGSSSTPPMLGAAVCICSASGTSISCSRARPRPRREHRRVAA